MRENSSDEAVIYRQTGVVRDDRGIAIQAVGRFAIASGRRRPRAKGRVLQRSGE